MENRQLNLLDDLETYEERRNTEHVKLEVNGLFEAAFIPLREFNPTLSRTIDNSKMSTSVVPDRLETDDQKSCQTAEERSTLRENLTFEKGCKKRSSSSPASGGGEELEEEQMKGFEHVVKNSEFDTMSWIKKNGDNGYLSDLSFLKDLKEKKLPSQDKVRVWYLMRVTQIAVAVFIILNFLLSAVKAQRQPQTHRELYVFEVMEIIFAFIFAFELAVNMYGSWCRPFFESGWNWFDLIIVLISLFTLGLGSGIPGITTLRLFRAFRVIRLFKRIPSLKKIVEGVIQAIPGVSNALIVLIMIMSIWSILGVEFYATASPENFGTFSKGMFSMFQCMTLDSWSGIARPLIKRGPMHWFFFCSYVLIAGIIMVNVVVAVLLEKFIGATGQKWMKKKIVSNEMDKEDSDLAVDDMMMDRLLFLEMEFVKVNDKLDALISSLLDKERQACLQEELERDRNMSFLRTRTGKLAMHRARIGSFREDDEKY